MKKITAKERIIIEWRNNKDEYSADSSGVYYMLNKIGREIYNGRSSGLCRTLDNSTEIAWESECQEFGGIRHHIIRPELYEQLKTWRENALKDVNGGCEKTDGELLDEAFAYIDNILENDLL